MNHPDASALLCSLNPDGTLGFHIIAPLSDLLYIARAAAEDYAPMHGRLWIEALDTPATLFTTVPGARRSPR